MRNEKNRDDFIVIDKRKIEDKIFLSLFILVIIVFCIVMIRGVTNVRDKVEIDMMELNPEKMAQYSDSNLNIIYAVPGDTWGLAYTSESDLESDLDVDAPEGSTEVSTEVEGLTVEEIMSASRGDDGIFDIVTDALSAEILSSMYVNQTVGQENKQFMSFTFRPDMGYNEGDFLEYCKASFERDLTQLNSASEELKFKLVDTDYKDKDSIMLKGIVTRKVYSEAKSEGEEVKLVDFDLHYTQYIKRIGKNLMIITFGSINEDDSVDVYLNYFANSVINKNSMN